MSDLLGHQNIEVRFRETMQRAQVHHAWLLHGVRGIGKSVLASKLAALLLCEEHSACGKCHSCQMLHAGSHPDFHSVSLEEKKRDISIAQVRELLAFLSLSGAEGERRVVILDDAERLNHQAANALLKGLEEPASGSVLLMVCSDAMKLPATVRSRCLMQHCSPLSEPEVRIVLADKVAKDSLDLAVAMADGCPGSVSCLEDEKVAKALNQWRQLTRTLSQADVGEIDNWCRTYVTLVPHDLIVRALLQPVQLQLKSHLECDFDIMEATYAAVNGCLRWPGEVVRQSLRAAPSLLSHVLELRSALRTVR